MCGIYGLIGPKANDIQAEEIKSIMKSLRHRGPDHQAFIKDRDFLFVHTRLSIIDLSNKSNQPFENENFILLYNGEIYNYLELAEKYGVSSSSDSRCLFELCCNMSLGRVVSELDGMFAIAFYDKNKKILTLARDAFGEKPLYYSKHQENLFFSSELKAFKGVIPMEIELKNLYFYFRGACVPAPNTAWKNTYKLEPGELLEVGFINGISFNKTRYFTPNPNYGFFQSLNIMQEIKKSIELRCRADVPVGVFLSGGYDSSAIAYFQQSHQENVSAFTVGMDFDHTDSNEIKFSEKVARSLGIKFFYHKISEEEFIKEALDLENHLDDFICDPVVVPLSFVSQLAKSEGFKVVLGGEGADEIFGGYRNYVKAYWAQKLLGFAKPILPKKLSFQQWEDLFPKIQEDYYRRLASGYDVFLTGAPSMSDRIAASICHLKSELVAEEWVHSELEGYGTKKIDQRIQLTDLRWRLPELLLMRLDFVTMKHSLEVRAPFLSKDLLAIGLNLDVNQKWKGPQNTKVYFRNTLNSFLPEIVKRPKQGFCGNAKAMLTKNIVKAIKEYTFDHLDMDQNLNHNLIHILEKRYEDLSAFQRWTLFQYCSVQRFWSK